jgi:hypothetical protein
MAAIITGTNSRRSSSEGIRLTLYRFQGTSLPELVSKQLTSLPGVPVHEAATEFAFHLCLETLRNIRRVDRGAPAVIQRPDERVAHAPLPTLLVREWFWRLRSALERAARQPRSDETISLVREVDLKQITATMTRNRQWSAIMFAFILNSIYRMFLRSSLPGMRKHHLAG